MSVNSLDREKELESKNFRDGGWEKFLGFLVFWGVLWLVVVGGASVRGVCRWSGRCKMRNNCNGFLCHSLFVGADATRPLVAVP